MSQRHRPSAPPHRRRRQWLARVMVVAAAVALMATSGPEDTLRQEVTADVAIGEPARFEVEVLLNEAAASGEFETGPQLRTEADGYYPTDALSATADRPLPDVAVTVTPLGHDGARLAPTSDTWVEHPADCPRSGPCLLRYEVRVAARNTPHPAARATIALESYVEYGSGGLFSGPAIPDGAELTTTVTDAQGRDVTDAPPGDRPETVEVPVGGHDRPWTRIVFVRDPDAVLDPIAARTGGDVRLTPVDGGLPGPDSMLATEEAPLALRPFDGCAVGVACLREYDLVAGSSVDDLLLTLPDGVRVEPGSLDAPPLHGTQHAPASDVVTVTTDGQVVLTAAGATRRDHALRLPPQEAPTFARPWLSAGLEVTIDAASDATVIATLADAQRQLGEGLHDSAVGTWVSGTFVFPSPSPSEGDDTAGGSSGGRDADAGGPAYEALLPVGFESTGPVTITWRLTVHLPAHSMLLPAEARPELAPVEAS